MKPSDSRLFDFLVLKKIASAIQLSEAGLTWIVMPQPQIECKFTDFCALANKKFADAAEFFLINTREHWHVK